jgi:hypothetical protein
MYSSTSRHIDDHKSQRATLRTRPARHHIERDPTGRLCAFHHLNHALFHFIAVKTFSPQRLAFLPPPRLRGMIVTEIFSPRIGRFSQPRCTLLWVVVLFVQWPSQLLVFLQNHLQIRPSNLNHTRLGLHEIPPPLAMSQL